MERRRTKPRLPGDVVCDICGAGIKKCAGGGTQNHLYHDPGLKMAWSHVLQDGGGVWGSADDLAACNFDHPWLWACFFRTSECCTWLGWRAVPLTADFTQVYWMPNDRDLHISGVSMLSDAYGHGSWAVPVSQDQLLIGDVFQTILPLSVLISMPYPSTVVSAQLPAPTGHAAFGDITNFVHDRCWILLRQFTGDDYLKTHFKLFVRVMKERRDSNSFEMEHTVDEETRMLQQATSWGHPDPKHMEHDFYQTFKRQYFKSFRCLPRAYGLRDPIVINEMPQKLIEWKNKPRRKSMTQWMRPQNTAESPQIQFDRLASFGINIHSDIVLQILDFLPLDKDLRALIEALPDWGAMIPPRYWRFRFSKAYGLRMDQLPAVESLNWRAIFLGIEQPFATLHGWQNRQRIWRNLEKMVDSVQLLVRQGVTEDDIENDQFTLMVPM